MNQDLENKKCIHCKTPLRKNQQDFCCLGCEYVYQTINSYGLNSFYKIRDNFTVESAEQVLPDKKYDYLNYPEIYNKIITQREDGNLKVDFYLPTIHCAACVWLLEYLPKVIEGVIITKVSYQDSKIQIVFNPKIISLNQLAEVLNSIGYPPVPAEETIQDKVNKQEDQKMLIRIGIAAVAAANTMMFSDALIESTFSGIEDKYRLLFTWISAGLAFPVVTYCSYPFYKLAVGSLILGMIHLDLPISLAIIISYFHDIYSAINGSTKLYFDSITCLVFLLLTSRFLQKKAVYKSKASISTTWDYFPTTVRIKNNEDVVEQPLNTLNIGDIVIVNTGERIPSDGIVIFGNSSIDSAFLTGESKPVIVEKDSGVLGGSLNLDSEIHIKITATGNKTRLGKIISHIKEQQNEKTKLENEVDKISKYFVIIVLAITLLTYLLWFFVDESLALQYAISVLIITCPCALGLAIPATITVALSQAQKNKIFIKNSESLNTLSQVKNFYFDKTGTLTTGKLELVKMIGESNYVGYAASLAEFTNFHPVSKVISESFSEKKQQIFSPQHIAARGVSGVTSDGSQIFLSSYRYLKEKNIELTNDQEKIILSNLNQGLSVSIFSYNNIAKIIFILEDEIIDEVSNFINELIKKERKIFILSGDNAIIVKKLAQKLGIPEEQAMGDLYPEEKAKIIRNDKELSVMIGDGINDSLAMQVASVSVGLKGGIESTLECADIFVAEKGITGFINIYEGSFRVNNVIKRNLYFSYIYNLIGGGAAVLGYVNPLIASIMMPLSSFTVILSSVMTRYFKR